MIDRETAKQGLEALATAIAAILEDVHGAAVTPARDSAAYLEAAALRAPDLMRRMLADKIQTEALGRDEPLERKLAALVRGHGRGETPRASQPMFRPGTVLMREHQGRTHRVEVVAAGFLWQNANYKSLSEIARAITGVRWNGPRFFGLREPKATGAAR